MVGIHETWRSCSLKYFLSNLLCKNGTGIECTFESSGKHDMWDIFEELSLGRAKKFPLQFFLQKREQYCANINGMEKLYWNPDNFSCPGANFDFRLLEKLHHGSKQVIQKEVLNLETLPLILISPKTTKELCTGFPNAIEHRAINVGSANFPVMPIPCKSW